MSSNKKTEVYKCPECGFIYKSRAWADKCAKFCKKNKACSLKITKHAIQQ